MTLVLGRGMGAASMSVYGTPLKKRSDLTPEALGLPSVHDYSQRLEQALAAVSSNAQARAAVGAATQRISDGYDLALDLRDTPDADVDFLDRQQAELDRVNAALSAPYSMLPNDDGDLVDSDAASIAWLQLTPLIVDAYLAVYLLQFLQRGLDSLTPVDFSPIALLSLAIARVGKSTTDVIVAAGDAVKESVKGAAMAWWPVVLAGGAVVAGIYFLGPRLRGAIR